MVISNLKFSMGGGGILEYTLVISNLKFSIGGYFRVNFGHLKCEVFRWGGILEYTLVISNLKFSIFGFCGGILEYTLVISNLKFSIGGGGGGLSGLKFQKGAFWRIWTKIYCSARNLLVHHR